MPCKQKKKKVLSLFTFLVYPIDRLDYALFTHVQCCDIVPSLVSSFGESLDIGLYFAPQLPRGFDHFYGAGRGGEPPPPHSAGRGGEPPPPRGEGSPRGGAPIPDENEASNCAAC